LAWREWPLVAFTLLGQLAAGFYLVFVVPVVFAGRAGEGGPARNATLSSLATVVVMLGVAAAASLFHLGRPLRASNSLANLRTSWLSREILFELLFGLALAVLFVLVWFGKGEGAPAKATAGLAAVCAVLFLTSMARLYMVPGVPAWNRAATPLSFFLTTAVLGSLGALVAVRLSSGPSSPAGPGKILMDGSWVRLLAVIAVVLVILRAVGHLLFTPDHGVLRSRAAASLKPEVVSPRAFLVLRIVLLAGGGVATLAALRAGLGAATGARGVTPLIWAALALAAASELLARFGFYAFGDGRR
jgi:anaerobic dimethyl sulfoxide reductase subunit C (anchor subunit)